MLLAGF